MNALQPDGEDNQRLESNVHPPTWTNPTPTGPYHLVVIGAGTAGLVTAAGAAGLGAKVALIERDLMGGDCLNVGCVPSKGVISAARVARGVRRSADHGVKTTGDIDVDFTGVMQRMRRLRAEISENDSASRFSKLGVDVFFGSARFVDSQTIEVADQTLKFKRAVIATGARAAVPSIPGLDDVNYLTNESVFSLTELPKRFGVIGAGPIGCELAQAFAQLGSEAYLIDSAQGILSKEDPDAADIVRQSLIRDGVHLLCCGRELKVRQSPQIHVSVEASGTSYDHSVDQLLVAVGRTPNVEGLNLESVGVAYDRHGVQVDDHLQTTNAKIFAAGDVCSKFKFTHAADFAARMVIQNALFAVGPLGKKKFSDLIIPWSTYTTPEIAHVGISERQADEDGVKIDTYRQSMSEVDRAILDGETDGFVKIHTRKGTDRILGATIVARHAGDLISQITLAMQQKIGLGAIANVIHPYPTQAEAIRKLGDQYNRTRLTATSKSVLAALRRFNVGS
ncbi:mercuric reductase [Crateriforma spongiae]|uniref:mercuric reductase n=1 Tax=Crateriforma spongiae TaxID=2724528 RepID=UPI0039B01919